VPSNSNALRASWERPLETGDGSTAWPLTRYEVQVTDHTGDGAVKVHVVAGTTLSLELTGVEAGARLSASVRAVNAAGESPWSASLAESALVLPGAPTALQLELAEREITLSFAAPAASGAAAGDASVLAAAAVLVAPAAGCGAAEELLLDGAARTVTLGPASGRSLTPGCTYVFSVRVSNALGFGPASEEMGAEALAAATAPRALGAAPGRAREVLLTWSVPADTGDGRASTAGLVLRYAVQAAASADFATLLHDGAAAGDAAGVAVGGLPVDVPLHFRVWAVNAVGAGAAAVAAGAAVIPPLRAPAVDLASPLTGAALGLSLSCELSTALPAGGRLRLLLPPAFDARAATLLPGSSSAWTLEDQLRAAVTLVSSAALPAGAAVRVHVGDVRNPHAAGPPGPATLESLPPAGAAAPPAGAPAPDAMLVDVAREIPLAEISPGGLGAPAAALEDPRTGRAVALTVQFELSARNALPRGGAVRVVLPAEMREGLAGAALEADGIDAPVGLLLRRDGALEVTVGGAGGANAAAPGARVALTFAPVRTPPAAGTTGALKVEVRASDGALVDTAAIPGLQIAPGALADVRVAPADGESYRAKQPVALALSFALGAAGLPPGAALLIELPAGLELDSASLAIDADLQGLDELVGSFTVAGEAQTVRVSREGGGATAPAGLRVHFVLRGVRCRFQGPTGAFALRTVLSAADAPVEVALDVPGGEIVASPVQVRTRVGAPRVDPQSCSRGCSYVPLCRGADARACAFACCRGRAVVSAPERDAVLGPARRRGRPSRARAARRLLGAAPKRAAPRRAAAKDTHAFRARQPARIASALSAGSRDAGGCGGAAGRGLRRGRGAVRCAARGVGHRRVRRAVGTVRRARGAGSAGGGLAAPRGAGRGPAERGREPAVCGGLRGICGGSPPPFLY
jgi:hypothetical protein